MKDVSSHLAFQGNGTTPLDPPTLVIVERLVGAVTGSELQALTTSMIQRWDQPSCVHLLVDLSEASLEELSLRDLRAYIGHADRIGLHRLAPRIAIVAPRDVTHGLARLYRTLARLDDGALAVFASVSEAMAWIRRPLDAGTDGHEPGAHRVSGSGI